MHAPARTSSLKSSLPTLANYSRGEPDGLRAELSVGEGGAHHVEGVHLGNVHALALAASHLAAADVLAVVALRDFSENTRCARVSRSRVGRRNDAKRLEKVYDDDEKRREKKKKVCFPARAVRLGPGRVFFVRFSRRSSSLRISRGSPVFVTAAGKRGEARGRRTAVFTLFLKSKKKNRNEPRRKKKS